MNTRILIVEDELIIAEDIREKMIEFGYETVDVVDNFEDTLACIEQKKPDLILLDIALRGSKTGIDIAKVIDKNYELPYIFLTSNHDAATLAEVKAVHPASFLMKPFKKEELYMAIELAFASQKMARPASVEKPDHIFIKEGHSYQKITISEIQYLKSEGIYIEIYTPHKRYITRDSFKNILDKLPAGAFIQTHKSYFIHTQHIRSVTAISVWVADTEIPLGRTHKEEVFRLLGLL
jgi:DNA-binding LytR/AlgR family response regulator